MATKSTPDEQPKRQTARRVVAEKRRYFVPDHGVTVEAESSDKAVEKAKQSNTKQEEVGDADK